MAESGHRYWQEQLLKRREEGWALTHALSFHLPPKAPAASTEGYHHSDFSTPRISLWSLGASSTSCDSHSTNQPMTDGSWWINCTLPCPHPHQHTHLGTVLNCALVSAGLMSLWQLLSDTSSSSCLPTPSLFSCGIPLKWHTPGSLVCFWGNPN